MEAFEKLYYTDDFKTCLGPIDINIKNIENFHPNTLKIASSAFRDCKNLESVCFDENIEEIGKCAFKKCEKLKNITFPEKLEMIEEFAFADCKSLKEVILPKYVGVAEEYAFENCNLSMLTLPEKINDLSSDFLENCNIEKTIVSHAFYAKYTIRTESFESKSQLFNTKDGILFDKDGALLRFPSNRTTFPNIKVPKVRGYAFKNCILKDINLENVIIGTRAFCEMTASNIFLKNAIFDDKNNFDNSYIDNLNLNNCKIPSNDEDWMGVRNHSLFGKGCIKNITVHGGDLFKNDNLIYDKNGKLLYVLKGKNLLKIPSEIKKIGEFAFIESNAKMLIMENSSQTLELDEFCFSENKSLEEIIFNRPVDLGTHAFALTPSLKTLYLPKHFVNYMNSFDFSSLETIYTGENTWVPSKEKFLKDDLKENGIKLIIDNALALKDLSSFIDEKKSFKEINKLYNEFTK